MRIEVETCDLDLWSVSPGDVFWHDDGLWLRTSESREQCGMSAPQDAIEMLCVHLSDGAVKWFPSTLSVRAELRAKLVVRTEYAL